jgi:hypothetical protein
MAKDKTSQPDHLTQRASIFSARLPRRNNAGDTDIRSRFNAAKTAPIKPRLVKLEQEDSAKSSSIEPVAMTSDDIEKALRQVNAEDLTLSIDTAPATDNSFLPKALGVDKNLKDDQHNKPIENHFTHDINRIIKMEVDQNLDQLTRQAVRDALKTHQA